MKRVIVILFLCLTSFVVAQHKSTHNSKHIDSLSFKKESILPKNDSSYNSTFYEMQKYKAFHLKTAHIKDQKKYLTQLHTFTKDSLKILAVKLLSIKQLDSKKLLDKDIAQHRDFYVLLLHDLKESDIDPSEYLFLENKLSKVLISELKTKYTYSWWLNIILIGLLIGSLSFMWFSYSSKKKIAVSLSRQETTIKNLILNGKSNKEIAEELFISLSTVKTHITNIYQKLNISNRNELVSTFKNTTSTST